MPSIMDSQDISAVEWSIRVDCHGKQPPQFNSREIAQLFHAQIDCKADNVTELLDNGKKWIRLSFNNEDIQKKAVSVTGLSIGGANLTISILKTSFGYPPQKPRLKPLSKFKRGPDTRRNLYVLNLPHDLSEQAYFDLFTSHGTPTHAVLLKTHDSCSRRRGFVVMSSHEEARQVITWLDGVCVQGFQLRVTWANIDRSNGFMSGYDRSNLAQDESASMRSLYAPFSTRSKSTTSPMDVNTIVASNIPVSLFPKSELEILFKPFGQIRSIQVIPPHPPASHPLATLAPASPLAQTAIVTFESANDAIAAKNTLHGQIYEGFTLAVGFVANPVKEDSVLSKSSVVKPFTSSTNSATHYANNMQALSPIAMEQLPRPHSMSSYETIPLLYAAPFQPVFTPQDSWMPYSARLPQVTFENQPQPQPPVFSEETTFNHGTPSQKQSTSTFLAYLTHQAATRG